ncbi:MAG: DNA repair protein RadC [Oscillospiraceae bacterium]|nr:DNA repair protein RadC [Oscillospiraceae bacterium]
MSNSNNIHVGHRQRMRDEYEQKGLDHLPCHRVLEMLLHFAIPQRDTNNLAHELIEIFGSFSQVFAASIETLASVKGMTRNAAVLIHMLPEVNRRIVEDQLNREWVLDNNKAIAEYLSKRFVGRTRETVMLLCLDNSCRLIACRVLNEGNAATTQLSIRQLCEAVFQCGCHNVVLAHNHPGGLARPSNQDIRLTERLFSILHSLDIRLLDHFIVTETQCESMANMGYLGMEKVFR